MGMQSQSSESRILDIRDGLDDGISNVLYFGIAELRKARERHYGRTVRLGFG